MTCICVALTYKTSFLDVNSDISDGMANSLALSLVCTGFESP